MGRRTSIGLVAALGMLLAIGYAAYGDDLLADESATASERRAAGEPHRASAVPADDAPRTTTRRVVDRTRLPDPVRLDPRCQTGRAMCVDKTTRKLRWVVDGTILKTFDVRFGGPKTPTREGEFEVYDMLRHHESSLYGTQMPFAMFFSGGQAVHYSKEFRVEGYDGFSHGCVNVRDRRGIAELFDRVREGDKVIVYRS